MYEEPGNPAMETVEQRKGVVGGLERAHKSIRDLQAALVRINTQVTGPKPEPGNAEPKSVSARSIDGILQEIITKLQRCHDEVGQLEKSLG
jgi:hypothetical protein